MKNRLLVLVLSLLTLLCIAQTPCDTIIKENNLPATEAGVYDFYLDGVITACDKKVRYTIDYDFQTVPDRFEVWIDGEFLLESEWIGHEDYDMPNGEFVLEGFIDYTLYLNGDHSIFFRANVPSTYRLNRTRGSGRLFIYTYSDKNVLFRVYSHEVNISQFELNIHCKHENVITKYTDVYVCHVPEKEREHVVTEYNCDTIVVDSIYVGNIGTENTLYDTIRNFPGEPRNDTTFARNEYDCDIPYKITTYIPPPVSPYIPNTFSPNGDGVNDVFIIFPLRHGVRYEIFNRWGAKVHDSYDGWSPLDAPAGVYGYKITIIYFNLPYIEYGDITLVR